MMKMKSILRMAVALLAAFGLLAGVPQQGMAKKKATATSSAKADSGKNTKSSKSRKTSTSKKASASSKTKEENKLSKADADAKELVSDLTTTQKKKLLGLLNDGDVEALTAVTGVGGVRAKAIMKGRPFTSIEDLREVEGVGSKVFGDVVAHGKTMTGSSSAKSAKSKTGKKSSTRTKKSS